MNGIIIMTEKDLEKIKVMQALESRRIMQIQVAKQLHIIKSLRIKVLSQIVGKI